MFRYAIVLILVNPYYYSLGVPTQPLFNSLSVLSNSCENAFVSGKIREYNKNCSLHLPPNSAAELRCLMFYDINRELCAAFRRSKVNIAENFDKNLINTKNSSVLCKDAASWKFRVIEEYSNYKLFSDEMSKSPKMCLTVCSDEDNIFNSNPNFFCKYFKWGSDLLNNQSNESNKEATSLETSAIGNNVTSVENKNNSDKITTTANDKNELIVPVENIKPTLAAPVKLPEHVESALKSTVNESVKINSSSQQTPIGVVPADVGKLVESNESQKKKDIDVPLNEDSEKVVNDKNSKQSVLESSKSVDQDAGQDVFESDIDSEDDGEQDGLPDDERPNSDPKLTLDKVKSNEKKIVAIAGFNEDSLQRDLYSNTIQETFEEEDDHFFPFFLTAIIVVILLYVLYHNKSKFTKVILGLIVEGRQSNRRRNSRGHAYRRLDTLEQAMSTNSAAPPSKIIY